MRRLNLGMNMVKALFGLVWLMIDAIRVALFVITLPAHWDRSKKPLVDRIAYLIEYKRYFLDIPSYGRSYIENYILYRTAKKLGYVPNYMIEKTYTCRCFYYWGIH